MKPTYEELEAEVARWKEAFPHMDPSFVQQVINLGVKERDDLRARLREMTDLALAGQEAFEKLRLTTPPPPSPDAKLGELVIDAAFEMVAATKKPFPKEGSPGFFELTDVAHQLECACIAYKRSLVAGGSK